MDDGTQRADEPPAAVRAGGRAARAAGLVLAFGLVVGACGAPAASSPPQPAQPAVSAPGQVELNASAPPAVGPGVVGTIVRFTSGATSVDVTIDRDSPAARDLVAMLPLTLEVEEFAGREKIAYPPRRLASAGTPGSDPEDGDLIYYVPWGNLGFYYDTSGVGYSDQTLHLGTYRAAVSELTRLQGPGVRVDVVR